MASVTLKVKWQGKTETVSLSSEDTISTLKAELHARWGVLPKRQKLMGIKHKGQVPDDTVCLGALKLKPTAIIRMMGSLEEQVAAVDKLQDEAGEVVDDFEIPEEDIKVFANEINLAKIARRVESYNIEVINEPRPGKRLLVLDIDYTLYDHRSSAENMLDLTRPHLHEFLTRAYVNYDIVIWSATNMKWVQAKMKEMGCLSHPDFRIAFCMCSYAMITVDSPKYGVVNVKPLGVIWAKYPGVYTPRNTIMFDDIRRNFSMNPENGLRIRACRNLPTTRGSDTELLKLARYLEKISSLSEDQFAALDHRRWEDLVQE
eukprot:m.488407 g.488407  ORF g.488407 m.488407 type:complete len:317 (+) comp25759_c0_seq1:63-1013(+)